MLTERANRVQGGPHHGSGQPRGLGETSALRGSFATPTPVSPPCVARLLRLKIVQGPALAATRSPLAERSD